MISNANLFTLLGKVQAPWRFDRTSVNLVCMPLFHIGGCGGRLRAWRSGATSILVRDFDPAQILEASMQANGSPTPSSCRRCCSSWPRCPAPSDRDFSSAALASSTARRRSPTKRCWRAMRAFKCEFVQVYGLTETHRRRHRSCRRRPRSRRAPGPSAAVGGQAVPGVELAHRRLRRRAATCRVGEVGEIWTRSAQNMKGYWNKPEETAATIHRRRLVQAGRRRLPRRGRLSLHPRPGEGHDRVGRRERLSGRGRERAGRATRRSPTSR